jgi:MoaA/NifB/PqqE/SkfB family radical SAM enzyme
MVFTAGERYPYVRLVRSPEKILYQIPFLIKKLESETPVIRQLELQPTDICNLNCNYCSYKKLRKLETLPPSGIKRTKELLNPNLVMFLGGGEPTMYRDGSWRYENVVDCFRDGKPRKFGLITNGVVFPELESWRDFEWVRVSLDAGSPETYESMKGADRYGRVVSNILKWCSTETAAVGVGIVLQNSNLPELKGILKFWQETKSRVNVQLRPIREYDERIPENPALREAIAEVDELCRANPNFERFLSERTNYNELKENQRGFWVDLCMRKNKAKRCFMPLLTATVRPDGGIYPCDNTPQRDASKKLGNLSDDGDFIAERQLELVRKIKPGKCPGCRYDEMNIMLGEILEEVI